MTVDVRDILKGTGALMEGHFLLNSGRHSPYYLEKFQILQHPQHTAALCSLISEHFRERGVEVVAGPTTGGIIISYEVARLLGVRGIFAEGEGTARTFRRGFTIVPGERVLVVDDILTTGGSVREVLEAVRRLGGAPVGVGVLVDRSQGGVDFGVPFFSCYSLPMPSYPAEECPQCALRLPLVKPGGA